MSLIYADRVKETTSTAGTGTLTLAGPAVGHQAFSSALADGDSCHYCVTDGTEWEVGSGAVGSGGTTLARTVVFDSSNSGAPVNFGAGTKDVFLTVPADRLALLDDPVFHPGLVAGRWYAGFNIANSLSVYTLSQNILYLCPLVVPTGRPFDRIAVNVQSGFVGSAGSVARLGMYTASNGLPDTLVLDAGTVAIDVAGSREITIGQTLDPGWYFMCAVHNSSTTIRVNAAAIGSGTWVGLYGQVSTNTMNASIIMKSFTFGGLPPTLSGSFTYGSGDNQPLVWVRTA